MGRRGLDCLCAVKIKWSLGEYTRMVKRDDKTPWSFNYGRGGRRFYQLVGGSRTF